MAEMGRRLREHYDVAGPLPNRLADLLRKIEVRTALEPDQREAVKREKSSLSSNNSSCLGDE
jgi:hypothetical protein